METQIEEEGRPGRSTGCLGRIVQATLFGAVIAVAFASQLWASVGGAATSSEVNGALVTAAQAGVTALLLLPFALLWRPVRERAIYRTWLLAALYPLLLAPTRLLPPTQSAVVALLQLLLTLLFVLGLRLAGRSQRQAARDGSGPAWGLAIGAAALLALPWLTRGALGSSEEALLALLLGLAFGAAAASLPVIFWQRGLLVDSRGRGADILTGGLVLGAALVIMASALSLNGLQLALMAALPSSGIAAAALAYAPRGMDWRPPALLLGLGLAAPLAFTDPGTMAVEAGDPALGLAWQAALLMAFCGALLAAAALIRRRRWGAGGRSLPALAGAAALWAAALVVYAVAGIPGFYGDRLFVILDTQADVAFAAALDDYDERRQTVYTTLVEHAQRSQAPLRTTLERWRLPYTPYYLVNAVEVEGGLLASLLLGGAEGIDRILPSPRLRPLPGPLDPGGAGTNLPDDHAWNLAQIGSIRAGEELGARGQGIVIGQSDSGVDGAHAELADGYRGRGESGAGGREGSHDYAWFDPWSHTPAPVDYGGHGTHTLATVAGNTTGVAPDATWIACANLQRNLGNPALYLDCLQFMLAPFPIGGDPLADGDPLQSAHVLNNSWGCPQEHEGCDATSLQGAVDALAAAGIFVVASAGNSGPACSTVADPIALYASAFTVGAVDSSGSLAFFSSAGPVTADGSGRTKPDIAAPGVAIWSAFPGGQYAEMSGTSMAGPHVAGVVALMWSANPALIGDIERTSQILRQTARPFSGEMENPAALFAPDDGSEADGAPAEADSAEADSADADSAEADSAEVDMAQDSALNLAAGACILSTDAGARPNNLVGYGVVDAYAAVQAALAEP